MIMQHIDRSRSISGGMAASFVLHGALLLLLAVVVGRQAAVITEGGELTEIAYIEAKYGEDVAAKVKLKEKPVARRPEPPGAGINTDSAMKAPEAAAPDAPRPQPKAAPKPRPVLKDPVRVDPVSRPAVAEATVKAPISAPRTAPKQLAPAAQLAARSPQPQARQVIDASRLTGSLKDVAAQDVGAPQAAVRKSQEAFTPSSGGLKSRGGTVAVGEDVLASAGGNRRQAAVAEAPAALVGGGSLRSGGASGSYQAPGSALVPAGQGSASGKAVVDVDGPSGAGGGKKSGRKTILNYGSGGGYGGSLSGRQRIVEPAANTEIVTETRAQDQPAQSVAEVKLDGKGVNMTISGQIQGRKILKSVAPQYTDLARKKGWEGVVAVHFTVKADGRVKDNMYFEQTSVHRDLNQAAMQAIKQFVFAPLGGDQAAVEQWGVITIVFRLN
jgi:TonB family protein